MENFNMVNVGEQAPNFELFNSNKEKVQLSSFAGKKVVLAFYPGAFTGVCDKEVCTLRDSMTRFNNSNAVVLGISVDGPFALKEFENKYNLNFPLLSDFERSVTNAYGVLFESLGGVIGYNVSNRAVFILDESQKVSYAWLAQPNPGVEPNYDEILDLVNN